jgi:hypothetical protein
MNEAQENSLCFLFVKNKVKALKKDKKLVQNIQLWLYCYIDKAIIYML